MDTKKGKVAHPLYYWASGKNVSEKVTNLFIVLLLYVVFPGGWLYYIWACFTVREFGWMVGGILIPPLGVVLGIWSLLFGVPGFIMN